MLKYYLRITISLSNKHSDIFYVNEYLEILQNLLWSFQCRGAL